MTFKLTVKTGVFMAERGAQMMLEDVIVRERLISLLMPERSVPIRLLCAPAGFGKTVLAQQFIALQDKDIFVWLSLPNSSMQNPEYLLQQLYFKLNLADSNESSLKQKLATHSYIIVLDNYQPNAEMDTWLLDYIQHSSSQWLITTRRRPKWSLSRLLLDGLLLEVDSENLALNVAEITAILAHIAPTHNFCARKLHEQTDGWVAGLRLFLYAQAGRESFMHINLHRCPHLLDYLDDEVLASISVDDRHLLAVIAHAPFVDSAICAYFSEDNLALQKLLAKQAFLRLLAGSTERFTIYEPLRSMLKERYPQQKNILLKVLDFLEVAHRYLSLFGYAIAVADTVSAVAALSKLSLNKLLAENNLSLVLDGLQLLKVDDFIEQPKALLIAARALLMGGKLELAECYLSALPKQDGQGVQLALQAELALHRGQAQEACRFGMQALSALEQEEDWMTMILCFSCLTRAELALGQYEQAQRQHVQGLELARLKGEMLLECQLLLDKAQIEELAGHLHQALQVLDKIKILIGHSGGSAVLSSAEYIRRGWLLMLVGNDVAARMPLEQGQELSMASGTPIFFYSYVLLAQLDARQGCTEQAQQRLAEVQRLMYSRGISEVLYRSVLSIGHAGVGVLAHQYQPAMHLLEKMWRKYSDATLVTPPSSCPELFALMSFLYAQVLCSQGAIDEAIKILTQVLEKAEGAGFQVIVSQSLMALGQAKQQRGDTRQAERMLASAAAMAVRQGQGYLSVIGQTSVEQMLNPVMLSEISVAPLLEQSADTLLSPREHMVLELMAKGYSNAEIADILSISLHTVKAHAKKINLKFKVNRRTLAVARAKTLGLLS